MADLSLKGTLGQVGDLGKQAGKSLLEESKKTTKAAVSQVGFERIENQTAKNTEQGKGSKEETQKTNKDSKDIVNALYGSSDSGLPGSEKDNDKAKAAQKIADQNPDKTREEIQKIASLKQQLHTETYFDPTFNPARRQQEEQIEEQKKDQEEEQDKRWELQEKKEEQKEKDAILQQQKKSVEKRPGAG